MIAMTDFEVAMEEKLRAQRPDVAIYLEDAPSPEGEPFFRLFHVSTLASGITSRTARYECRYRILCCGTEELLALRLQEAVLEAFETGFLTCGGRTLAVGLKAACKSEGEPPYVELSFEYDDNRPRTEGSGVLVGEVHTKLY